MKVAERVSGSSEVVERELSYAELSAIGRGSFVNFLIDSGRIQKWEVNKIIDEHELKELRRERRK